VLAEQYAEAKQRAQDPQAEPERPMAIEDMDDSDRQLLRNQAARQLWDWLAERNPDLPLNPDTNLQLDLGIDSLEWLNLTLAIEQQAGVELDDEAITRIEIVRDLLQEVAEQAEAGHTVSEARLLEHPEEVLSAEQQHWLEPLPPRLRLQALALYTVNRGLMLGAFRLAVCGRERVPAQAQLVFAPNHTSYLDPFVLSAALPYRQLRQTSWGGSARIAFANPLFRRASRLAQAVPIEHRQSLISSLAFGAAILRRDRSLVWFPEGHRSDDGELLDFRPGIGMLLAHYPVPVVPVFIHGAHQALPVGRAIPRPLRITVTFGEPLRPQELEQQGEGDEVHERITGALREHSLALSRETLSRLN
jgi:long-chain acyl-CoA synthetase